MKCETVFIYCLKDPITGDVRYIGQTKNIKRRFQNHLNPPIKTKSPLGNWLRSLSNPPVLVVLHEVAENESWDEEERRYISCARALGLGLVNATDGGEGASGPKSPETRAAMSAARKGVLTGPHSPETNAAISKAMKGKHSGELNPMFGKKHSPEALEKLCANSLGENNSMFGRTHSSETRAKISAKLRASWAARKARQ